MVRSICIRFTQVGRNRTRKLATGIVNSDSRFANSEVTSFVLRGTTVGVAPLLATGFDKFKTLSDRSCGTGLRGIVP